MKILVLQLKRIGDLILTAPALSVLRRQFPDAQITLATNEPGRELLPALPMVNHALVYRHHRGGNAALWWKMVRSSWDLCLDFTGTDRSALLALLSKASRRVTFSWVKKSSARHMFYNRFVESSVRERHTADHYCDLLCGLGVPPHDGEPIELALPDWAHKKAAQLLDARHLERGFAMIHPGTARPEKYWPAERWAEVIQHLETTHRLPSVITGGPDSYEQAQILRIESAFTTDPHARDLSGRTDLLTLAALAARARIVLSVDTGAAHLAAAVKAPQIALFGPTNPFHWRPRHPHAVVLSAASPEPVTDFAPRRGGAPMNNLSTLQTIRAMDTLLAATPPDSASNPLFR